MAVLLLSVLGPLFSQAAEEEHEDSAAMEAAREALLEETGGQTNFLVLGERFELSRSDGEDVLLFDGQGWVGGDLSRLWIRAEAEYDFERDTFEDAEIQALFSRAISPYFDLQVGLRQDLEPNPSRTFAVVGLSGLAPYWFELNSALFVSDDGDVSARIEAEYELLLTQRWILQPRVEFNFEAQDVPELRLGSGLSTVEVGARLRYEIRREIAPYFGLSWIGKAGATADFARSVGEPTDRFSFVAGLRFWY